MSLTDVKEQLKYLESDSALEQLTPEEIDKLTIDLDPVRWAETYLHNPEKPKEPLTVRWYQKEMLQCQQKKKVYRCGRQIGKTICLCIEMLWYCFTNNYKKILLVCPYKSQVDVVWTQIKRLIADSPAIRTSISRTRDNPHTIEFNNGSTIRGFTAGSKTGNKATPVRGQAAHLIVLDEADYMGEEAINAVTAILTSDPNTRLIASSTPSGKREQFYKWCTDSSLKFKQFHFSSTVGPHWTSLQDAEEQGFPPEESLEHYFRNTATVTEYVHEYEAEFGDEEIGVFAAIHLDACLADYRYEDWAEYKYDKANIATSKIDRKGALRYHNTLNPYIMGVDWNRPENGTHIVVLEYMVDPPKDVPYETWWEECQNKWRIFWREEIHVKEMTQHFAVERILHLNRLLNLSYIYVDEGYGDVQIEMLRKRSHEAKEPRTHALSDRLVHVNASSTIEVVDPITNQKIKKPVKPFIINNAIRCIENHEIIIPRAEDNQHKLVGQLRDFRVKKRSQEGRPIYEGEDHIIDAFCLALYGYADQFTELAIQQHATEIKMMDHVLDDHFDRAGIDSRWSDNSEIRQLSDIPLGTFAGTPRPSFEEVVAKQMPGHSYKFSTDSKTADIDDDEIQPAFGGFARSRPTSRTTRGFKRTTAGRSRLFTKGSPGRRATF